MMKNMILAVSTCAALLFGSLTLAMTSVEPDMTPEQARAIAKEAYIYAYPMVDSYRILHAYFEDRNHPEYKAPWNHIVNIARVYTPEDKSVQTPNSDTPYSWLGLDLRSEPIVLSVPQVEKERYLSIQLIDLYTHNFDYIGSRTTGNEGGHFLVIGPKWRGEAPKGIKKVFRSETELMLAIYRTQLFDTKDITSVKKIQAGYKVQPLSKFLGRSASKSAEEIEFIKPLQSDKIQTSSEVFNQLNFLLQFCPTHPSERELMDRFAKIGISAGKRFDISKFSPDMQRSIEQGIADAWAGFAALKKLVDSGEVTSGDAFGSREHLQNNYLYRMAAAVLGIWGNTSEEAIYPSYYIDANGQPLDGANRYILPFAADQLPPVNAFWSLTMYELPASLLSANSLDRYLLNSLMLPDFGRDADGGITLYIQNESPGEDRETNWLPAPKGPFSAVLRLYWPKPEALNGTWNQPPLQRVKQ